MDEFISKMNKYNFFTLSSEGSLQDQNTRTFWAHGMILFKLENERKRSNFRNLSFLTLDKDNKWKRLPKITRLLLLQLPPLPLP